MNLESPGAAVVYPENWGRKSEAGELPDIRFCSDIYWGYWSRDNLNVKNLRVYGAHNVVNDATSLLVSRAFKNKKIEKLTPWPGSSFDVTTEEGQALIGKSVVGLVSIGKAC